MPLFIAHVSGYPSLGDEHVIPAEIEERVSRNVARVVEMTEIGDVTRIDLKVVKNNKTGAKHIDAFVHIDWTDTPVAVHTQAQISLYGKTVWYLREGSFWVVRQNNNPMSQEEVSLMKDLGLVIREMNATHEEIKASMGVLSDLDNYVTNIDSAIRQELEHAHMYARFNRQYGPRYRFMMLKYMRCSELIDRMKLSL